MSPETLFWLSIAVKMGVAGFFVIGATIAAERAGPLVGGLVTTLPVSAGPGYIFLALDHTSDFIARTALTGLVINAATALYSLIYVLLAPRIGSTLSLLIGLTFWVVASLTLRSLEWSVAGAVLLNVVVFAISYLLMRPFGDAPVPRIELRWTDIAVRAAMVAAMVAGVTTLSFRIGPTGSALVAGFPVVYTSMMMILGPRIGAAATGAVLAKGILGLAGFGVAVLTLHLTAIPFGTPIGLTLALFVAIVWNLAIYFSHRAPRRATIR